MRVYTEEMPPWSPVQSQKLKKSDRKRDKGKKRGPGVRSTIVTEDYLKNLTSSKLGGLD